MILNSNPNQKYGLRPLRQPLGSGTCGKICYIRYEALAYMLFLGLLNTCLLLFSCSADLPGVRLPQASVAGRAPGGLFRAAGASLAELRPRNAYLGGRGDERLVV